MDGFGVLPLEQLLRILTDTSHQGVWVVDPDAKTSYVNQAMAEMLRCDRSEIIGHSIFEFIDEEARPAAEENLERRRARISEVVDFPFRRKDGTRVWTTLTTTPIEDAEGRFIGSLALALDVTERKGLEEQLRHKTTKLAEAQQLARLGSWDWDVTTDHFAWSDQMFRLFGMEPGALTDIRLETYLDLVSAEDRERVRQRIEQARADHEPFSFDHKIVLDDGTTRVVHSEGKSILSASGRIVRMVGTAQDVTEHDEALRAKERSVSLLEATIEATADGILVLDRDLDPLAYNQRFLSMWRIPREVATARKRTILLDAVAEQLEDPKGFVRRSDDLHANVDAEIFDALRFKDGRVYERYSRPQRVKGVPIGRVLSFRDVTERERLLQRATFLSDASRLLGSLDIEPALERVAHLAVRYLAKLADGCAIDLFSAAGERRRLLAISRDIDQPMSPQPSARVLAGESEIYDLDGRSYLGVPLISMGRLLGAITLRAAEHQQYSIEELDVAEELGRRAAQAIDNAQLYVEAQEALRAREEFLAIAAHELRGPANAIHLSVQALKQGRGAAGETTKLYEILERQNRRLAQFVDELLDLGRIRGGKLRLDVEPGVKLGAIVREAVASLEVELARSGSSLSVDVPTNCAGNWDTFRIRQVVTNLLSNAIKFGRGKPIALNARQNDGTAILTVRDGGIGIEKELVTRVFDPFVRGVSVRHYGGLGIGLFIVKTIVDAHGGTIRVDSAPNEGTSFTVALPEVTT
jgi:PAS domain S-box-containing protein